MNFALWNNMQVSALLPVWNIQTMATYTNGGELWWDACPVLTMWPSEIWTFQGHSLCPLPDKWICENMWDRVTVWNLALTLYARCTDQNKLVFYPGNWKKPASQKDKTFILSLIWHFSHKTIWSLVTILVKCQKPPQHHWGIILSSHWCYQCVLESSSPATFVR